MSAIPARSSPVSAVDPSRRLIEKIPLENSVLIAQIGGTAGAESLDIVYRSPL